MAKKSSGKKTTRGSHAAWKGELSFGLVTISVEAFNALNRQRGDIHFHQLHDKCHSRIHYEKVCPIHGKVTNEEIVSGYEYEKDKYVEINSDQLDALRTHEERTLTIDAFVTPETVDPIYFDGRMYYLIPANRSAEEAYVVMVDAMQRQGRSGIGQVIFSGKQQLALVRPVDKLLSMAMLNYAAEINPPEKMGRDFKTPKQKDRQLKLAQELVKELSSDDFDFSQYEDTYRDKLEKLIASKVKGHKVVVAKETKSEPATINLMDALKKSVAQTRRSQKALAARTRKSRTA